MDWYVDGNGGVQGHVLCVDWPGSISAAWELVEEMPITVSVSHISETQWHCGIGGFEDFQGMHYVYEAVADTAPRAICLAYLACKAAK